MIAHQDKSTFYLVIGLKLKFSFASLLKGVLGKSITPQVHPAYHALEMGDTSFLCSCPLKDGKGFTQIVECKSVMGEKAFTNVINPCSSSIPSICVLSVPLFNIYIFQDLKRNDAKTAAWRKF